jgi:SET family sugar efflux transporter-like MFS transporter
MSFTAPYLSLFSIQRVGMVPMQLGLFMTVIAASGVAASTWAGKWSDRHGHHRELLLAALIAAAIGFVCLCFVTNYWALLAVGIAFLGAGGSAVSLVFSFGRATLPFKNDAERTFATATLRTGLSVAWVFGPSVGALILAAVGFYGLFLFAAACFALCGIVVLRMRTPSSTFQRASYATDPALAPENDPAAILSPVGPASAASQAASPELTAAAPPALWRAIAALTVIGLLANATMIVLPLYIVQGLHGTQINVSVMLGLGAFLEIPMMLALGARGAKLNKLRWLGACAAVHAVYFIAVASVTDIPLLIPLQALSAFVVAVTSCLGMTYVQDLMPRSPGEATALFFNSARVGSILSGMLSGLLVATIGYRGTFLFCGVLAAVAWWLFANPEWAFLRRMFPRRRDD